jgi:undecaprenyl pyrophosphate synthase
MLLNPPPHASGAQPPKIQTDLVPNHIAVVMDGNGRWAKERGLPRTMPFQQRTGDARQKKFAF